jgi:Family of unknown function (DUF5984)
MLFNFKLAPLAQFTPRQYPGNPGISWFDLTQGEYWLRAGESALLEYGDSARAAGAPRHCTYPVARLHEDFLGMLPYILEPVPAALAPYLSGADAAEWWEAYETWYDVSLGRMHDAVLQQIDGDAHRLLYGRMLDTSYLAPLTSITMWSDDENIHFSWDNRAGMLNGAPAWAAQYGEFQMPRREFLAEVQSFHTRLIEQMEARIEQVCSGALSSELLVDLDALVSEQESHADALHDALALQARTDWTAVERSMVEILEARQLA